MTEAIRREGPLDWLMMIFLSVFGVLLVVWRYGRLTGVHAALIFVHAFVLIIVVNVYMATQAISTFPGLEVENSYVASQTFDTDKAGQLALGWTVSARVQHGELHIAITDANGAPVEAAQLTGTFGRATEIRDDQTPDFVFDGQMYRAPVVTAPGNWNFRMEAVAKDGTPFHQRIVVIIES